MYLLHAKKNLETSYGPSRFVRGSRSDRDRRGLGRNPHLPRARLLLLVHVQADEEEEEWGHVVWHRRLWAEEKHGLL